MSNVEKLLMKLSPIYFQFYWHLHSIKKQKKMKTNMGSYIHIPDFFKCKRWNKGPGKQAFSN